MTEALTGPSTSTKLTVEFMRGGKENAAVIDRFMAIPGMAYTIKDLVYAEKAPSEEFPAGIGYAFVDLRTHVYRDWTAKKLKDTVGIYKVYEMTPAG